MTHRGRSGCSAELKQEFDCKNHIFGQKAALDYRLQGLFLDLILKKKINRLAAFGYRPHLFQVIFGDIFFQ